MDLNQLLYHHQVALIGAENGSSGDKRRWAGLCADYFAGRIRRDLGGYRFATAGSALRD